ncbi:DNA methyltransferase [Williamwhitmania taraxaci]|uniref:DNA methylase n=1 Tax=Williamwhitmania taraxaci TaxID=1640674 RepID=A0A1G6N705_9BACT|nr:DNA methyltransferase [Williamwhitmania taraxaci]SDC63177.1 DNA methylase [Williamwhitmania taraxaci]
MEKKSSFIHQIEEFRQSNVLIADSISIGNQAIVRYTGEFWTAKQRQANALHEISYRACFKPQLPRFFIEHLTQPGDKVYDPFSGRGTTALEAALMGRVPVANDINPLSAMMAAPRLLPPMVEEVKQRLSEIDLSPSNSTEIDLTMFYHTDTFRELLNLRSYLIGKDGNGSLDSTDRWIRMVATNRLTGHSTNFFSGYTFPPNQAVSANRQRLINQKREQVPPYKNVKEIIVKKTKDLLKGIAEKERSTLFGIAAQAQFVTGPADSTKAISADSVALTITSPPFLDIVQYSDDNWLRCWFNGIDADAVASGITMSKKVEDWCIVMQGVFDELFRITKPGGYVAFEVGEVKNGKIKLDEAVVPLGIGAGFICEVIVINAQEFTKTANIWGVSNNSKGTNTNRIVVFRKNTATKLGGS